MGRIVGCGTLLIFVGIVGLIISFFDRPEGSSRRAIWHFFEMFSEIIGSMPLASGLFIVLGIALILFAFGYEELQKEKRAKS